VGSSRNRAAVEAIRKLIATYPDAGHMVEEHISNMGVDVWEEKD
jgi:hypothetical protein